MDELRRDDIIHFSRWHVFSHIFRTRAGWRHGIGDVCPIEGFARAAFEAGVNTVTIGSDCHTVFDLGVNTLKCLERLEKVGYTHACTYENRRNRRVALKNLRLG